MIPFFLSPRLVPFPSGRRFNEYGFGGALLCGLWRIWLTVTAIIRRENSDKKELMKSRPKKKKKKLLEEEGGAMERGYSANLEERPGRDEHQAV